MNNLIDFEYLESHLSYTQVAWVRLALIPPSISHRETPKVGMILLEHSEPLRIYLITQVIEKILYSTFSLHEISGDGTLTERTIEEEFEYNKIHLLFNRFTLLGYTDYKMLTAMDTIKPFGIKKHYNLS